MSQVRAQVILGKKQALKIISLEDTMADESKEEEGEK